MLDCIIIGSGTAGVSAALTLKANAKSFLMFGRPWLSEKIAKAERIRNYPGLADISGEQFVEALQGQLAHEEISIEAQRVSGIYPLQNKFGVATQEGGYYESKTVLICNGVENVKTIEGETEFVGRGVSYCATCDGFLYKGKTIAVLCTSKHMEHEIELLAGFAQKVYLIAMYKDVAPLPQNVTVLRKMPVKLKGEKRIEQLEFSSAVLDGNTHIAIDGLFVLRETIAPAVLMNGLQTEQGHILVNREMQTNFEGCFAAGDCTGKPYQYAKAVGEGNIAAHSICAYLAKNK